MLRVADVLFRFRCGRMKRLICSQAFEGFDFCKAPTVTTGVPGTTCPDATEGPETTEDSPRSLLSPLSSIDSPYSSLKPVADLRNLRILEHDQLKIERNVKGSLDTLSAADSELRRSLRNHGTEENRVRICGLHTLRRIASEAAESRTLRHKFPSQGKAAVSAIKFWASAVGQAREPFETILTILQTSCSHIE